MLEILRTLGDAKGFIPHGHCYLWKAELVWLHILSDSLTAIAYYAISFMLVYFVHRRRDVPFDWIFLMFGSFIVACGTTHVFEVWTLWHPTYWLSGLIKAITASVSLSTAVLLVFLIPKALILPSPTQLEVINVALRNEITQRREAEEALQTANEQLEVRVGERTAELAKINESLQAEIEMRKHQEQVLKRHEQEFKALVEHAPDIIVRFDRDLRHVYVNPAIEVATGLPSTTFIGKTNRDLGMPEELVSEWDSVLRRVFETGQEGVMEFHFPTPSGLKYYQARIAPEQVTDGRIESILSIGRDITDRKLVEEALLRRTRQLEIISRASDQINSVLEIPAIMRTLIASALELVGAAAGTYGLMRQERMVFTEYHENGTIRPINATFERGVGVPGWVMETRQPYIANDAQYDPHVLPHLQKAFDFSNLVNIPIFNRQGELIGCFELHNKAEQRLFSDNDVTILQGLAASAAVALENAQMLVERKRAEEELQKSYNLLQSVIEGTPDPILVKDLQGRYVMLNSAVAHIQGKPKSEIFGRDDSELFGSEYGLPLMENDRRIITTGKTEVLEENIILEGALRTYLSTKSVWRDAQGNVIGLIVLARDISDRKRAEQDIRELNENLERRVTERTAELEATNQELESFSYSVSHDLRAPLRGIDGFSQALLDRYADQLDDKGKHYLQRIRVGTQRMGELIDDLLKLSRVTRSEMQRTQVDLSALAMEIAAELQRTQPERQVEWAIASGVVANGDARLLRILLENLLNNAWKFTSLHLLTRIEFNVILEDDAKTVYFIRDNGAGFEMAYVNKLFGAFQRLHSQTQFPGTGIGLATVQRIIHRHGGRVWAEGAIEQGATFYFTL